MADVAGLVLGGFPLIMTALEHYRDGFEPLQEWWRFEREFSNFIDDLGIQKLRFENNLQKLLEPFVTSDTQMDKLLDDGNPESWQEVRLQKELRDRLGKSYEWYCAICKKMRVTLDDLEGKIGIGGGQVDYIANTQWQHQLLRLRFSFSHKKFKHVKLLEKYNNDLQELLSSGDELACTRKRRRMGPAIIFLRSLQQHFQHLYDGLFIRRKCNNPTQHDSKILLERLDMQDDPENLRLHVILDACSTSKAIEIRIEDSISISESDEIPVSSHGSLLELKRQVHERAAATSSDSFRARIKKKLHGMKHSANSTMKSSKKRANTRYASDVDLGATPTSTKDAAPAPKPMKAVRFAALTSTESGKSQAPKSLTHVVEIKNICSDMLTWDSMTGCLGYIPSLNARLLFYPDDSCPAIRDQCTILTLENVLSTSENPQPGQIKMSQKQRFVLANILASAVLQLQFTYWMPSSLRKCDIKFFISSSSSEPVFSHPYISGPRHSAAVNLDTPKMSMAKCKKTLLCLGFLLLELTFNQHIETYPDRKRYMGPDRSPNEFTDFCTARKWLEDVPDAYGHVLYEAIGCCINFSFGLKAQNWNDEEFVEAYVTNVLEPLRDVLKPYEENF